MRANCLLIGAPRRRVRPAVPVRGFTLIETLVVFALLALLLAIVPVAYDRMHQSAQYRATVRAALDDLRAARHQAQSSGAEVRFAVRLAQRQFGLEGGRWHEVPEPLALRAVMAEQAGGSDGSLGIRFLPGGGATGGSLDILRPSGDGVRLRVDWFSGRVEQEPAPP